MTLVQLKSGAIGNCYGVVDIGDQVTIELGFGKDMVEVDGVVESILSYGELDLSLDDL